MVRFAFSFLNIREYFLNIEEREDFTRPKKEITKTPDRFDYIKMRNFHMSRNKEALSRNPLDKGLHVP